MYYCEICGREMFKKHSLQGFKCLCSKHMHQLHKFGKFLDSNPRTQKDLNKIIDVMFENVKQKKSEDNFGL